ncbi:MAG: hypothetical protein JXQ72_01160 [Anaerolineae bacterium]|nr:hypothetical protein [Anaerolineae bacterium]
MNPTSRIKTSYPYGQTPPNTGVDFAWAREHEADLLAQYGECVVLVYQQQVIGFGPTLAAAEQDAEAKLPPDQGAVTPVTVLLRQPLIRPDASSDPDPAAVALHLNGQVPVRRA